MKLFVGLGNPGVALRIADDQFVDMRRENALHPLRQMAFFDNHSFGPHDILDRID